MRDGNRHYECSDDATIEPAWVIARSLRPQRALSFVPPGHTVQSNWLACGFCKTYLFRALLCGDFSFALDLSIFMSGEFRAHLHNDEVSLAFGMVVLVAGKSRS
jgi:hypothetical protein